MEQNSSVQQQLLQHLMTEEGGLDSAVLSLITEVGGLGGADSESDSDSEPTPARTAAAARDKARRRTVNTQDLLFANGSGAPPQTQERDGERPSLLPLSRSHSHVISSSNAAPR